MRNAKRILIASTKSLVLFAIFISSLPNCYYAEDLSSASAFGGETSEVPLQPEAELGDDLESTGVTEFPVAGEPEEDFSVFEPYYSAHVQRIGWMDAVSSGETAGTVGKSLRIEALKIQLKSPDGATLPVFTQAHVSGIGWQDWVVSGSIAGTVGQSRAIEAIRFKLPDSMVQDYSIWYRVHAQEFGWLGWTCDGASAGSAGYGRRIEAMEVIVLPKGEQPAGSCENPFFDRSDEPPVLRYSSHISKYGWQETVQSGSISGTTGRSLPIEAIKVYLDWYGHDAGIDLRSHVAHDGWQAWSSGITGTTGKSKRIEAVQLRLRGEIAEEYDIWYSVHVSKLGWLGWASNGAPAGSTGLSYGIESIRIQLLPKGSSAPGDTSSSYVGDYEKLKLTSTDTFETDYTSTVSNSTSVGAEGGTALSLMKLDISNKITDGSVRYRVLGQFGGWSAWSAEGSQVGSSGDPLKGLSVELTGALSSQYDIWYRVHDSKSGWFGWSANGAATGSMLPDSYIDMVLISLVKKGDPAPGETGNEFIEGNTSDPQLVVQGHSARIGWQAPTYGDGSVGTIGRSLGLQAIRMNVYGAIPGDVEISAHVSKYGWQDWVSSGAISGTVGQSLPIEAIRIRLTGELAEQYSVYYRVHSAQYGWLGWAHDGTAAGTTGLNLQSEAIEVMLVKHDGSEAPSSTIPPVVAKPTVNSCAHVSTIGWLSQDSTGGLIGTTGKSLRLEAFMLDLTSDIQGSIVYSAHVQGIGWQPEVRDGEIAGTTGEEKRLEAVKIRLTGDLARYFDIWYRVHVEEYGWLGWTKNGLPAGTSKIGYRAEALEIRILPKGSAAPGPTSRPFTDEPAIPRDQLDMSRLANLYGSSTNWLIMVNTTTCRVGIYRGARGMWTQQAYWLCSPGAPGTPTVLGQYTVGAKGYVFGRGYSCYYYTQFYGDYLFHSILYDQGTFNVQDGRLGQQLSHGCVRLSLENAKWIWDNIPTGTKVVTYR